MHCYIRKGSLFSDGLRQFNLIKKVRDSQNLRSKPVR